MSLVRAAAGPRINSDMTDFYYNFSKNETSTEEEGYVDKSEGTQKTCASPGRSQASNQGNMGDVRVHVSRCDQQKGKKGNSQTSVNSDESGSGIRSWSKQHCSKSKERSNRRRQQDYVDPPTTQSSTMETDSLAESEVGSEGKKVIIVGNNRGETPALTPGCMKAATTIMADAKEQTVALVGEEDCPPIDVVWKEGGQGRRPTTGKHYLKRLEEEKRQFVEATRELRVLRNAAIPANLSMNRKAVEKKSEARAEPYAY